jgi:hypothetical protein
MKTNIEKEITILSQDEAIAIAKVQQPIIHEHVERYTFAIMNSYGTKKEEIELYNALGQESFWAINAASDFVVAWCKHNNVLWGSIRIDPCSIEHIKHGNPEHGHYCFDAYITMQKEEEPEE